MTKDKLKQYIALFGGWLGAVLLFLQSLNLEFWWFTSETIDNFTNVLVASVPFVLVFYGVYKNSFIITDNAKKQEKELKRKGLK